MLSNSSTLLKRNEVIEMFEDRENFVICHQRNRDHQF